jgi:peptidoglycan/LPS O-acetylase OafA/YrhL
MSIRSTNVLAGCSGNLAPVIFLTGGGRRRGLHLPTVIGWSLVIGVLGVAWQAKAATIPGSEGHYAQWLPGYLPWFLVGVCFAAVSASLAVTPRDHVLERLGHDLVGCWILATAAFAIACTPIAGPRTLLVPGAWEAGTKVVLYTIAGAFFLLPLVFGPEREGATRSWLAGPVPFWLGEISYGVFAIHLFVLNMAFDALGIDIFTGHFLTMLSVTVAVTLALASVSYYLFERPILRAKNPPVLLSREADPALTTTTAERT